MGSPEGLSARQALTLGSALLIMLAVPVGISAQEASPAPSPQSSAPATSPVPESSASPLPAPEPAPLQQALYPRGDLGTSVADVIEGGPGYIAVGGGSPDGLDLRAFVWLSLETVSCGRRCL